MKTVLIACLLLCDGCSFRVPADRTLQVYVDPEGFTVGELADIYSATLAWAHASGGLVQFDVVNVDQGENLIRIVSAAKGTLGAPTIVGSCYRDLGSTQTIRLVPITKGTSASWFKTVATHELGHCLGLGHDVTGTVMCKSIGPVGCATKEITCRDVHMLCDVWGCFADEMPVCKVMGDKK